MENTCWVVNQSSLIYRANPKDTIRYRKTNIVNDEVVQIITSGRNKVTYENAIRMKASQIGNFQLEMTFNVNDGSCIIQNTEKYSRLIKGNGTFMKNAEEWGDKKRNTLYLQYQINDGTNLHNVTDTLVFRDKMVKFMEFSPLVKIDGVWE